MLIQGKCNNHSSGITISHSLEHPQLGISQLITHLTDAQPHIQIMTKLMLLSSYLKHQDTASQSYRQFTILQKFRDVHSVANYFCEKQTYRSKTKNDAL